MNFKRYNNPLDSIGIGKNALFHSNYKEIILKYLNFISKKYKIGEVQQLYEHLFEDDLNCYAIYDEKQIINTYGIQYSVNEKKLYFYMNDNTGRTIYDEYFINFNSLKRKYTKKIKEHISNTL